jgi:ankyrin repeat protein
MANFHNHANDNLHAACSAGSVQRCQHLIEQGADVDEIVGGITPLHIAARGSNAELCKLLIVNGADVEIVDRDGKSPAFYAARYNNPGCLAALIEGGASMDHEIYDPVEDRDTTPVHEAAGYGHALCLEAICSHENDIINSMTADGETPLHRYKAHKRIFFAHTVTLLIFLQTKPQSRPRRPCRCSECMYKIGSHCGWRLRC